MESQQGSHVPGATEQTSLAYGASAGRTALSLVRVVAHCHQRKCRLLALNPETTHYAFLPTVTGWVTKPHDIKGHKSVVFMVTHPDSVHFRTFVRKIIRNKHA